MSFYEDAEEEAELRNVPVRQVKAENRAKAVGQGFDPATEPRKAWISGIIAVISVLVLLYLIATYVH